MNSPISIEIVQFPLNDESAAKKASVKIEELCNAGYSIIASGSTSLRDTPPPLVRNPPAVAWLILSNGKDLL
jgi:hypothetical protein